MPLPPIPSVEQIQERLLLIFPEGITNRNYCTREIAAKTVFVMLYIGATQGANVWIRPDQVTRMTDMQAGQHDRSARLAWARESVRSSRGEIPGRWYAVNTREPIRDETLRDGFIPTGAVKVREGLATTSSKPRYALTPGFAALFAPDVEGQALKRAIEEWQQANLSAGAMARIAIERRGAVAAETGVMVTFPSGETRRMAAGPSSVIAKAVIEEFAPRFLTRSGVVWLSESGNKVVARDDGLAKAIGLTIEPDRNLPDLILVDLGPDVPLLVFVEVVATDGAITVMRKEALLAIAIDAGFRPNHVAFLTAYSNRDHPAFKKTVSALAWQSFVWFVSEPDHIIMLREGLEGHSVRLSSLMEAE
jgi:hypothetical protein